MEIGGGKYLQDENTWQGTLFMNMQSIINYEN